MKRTPRMDKPDAKILKPLNPEGFRLTKGGEASGGGLLAFPFIQSGMQ
jgi:hypothetical protein